MYKLAFKKKKCTLLENIHRTALVKLQKKKKAAANKQLIIYVKICFLTFLSSVGKPPDPTLVR
jgi:hypothetical protein